jgi:hypothetical protein
MELHTMGIDLGKTVFRLVDLACAARSGAQEVFAQATAALHGESAGSRNCLWRPAEDHIF